MSGDGIYSVLFVVGRGGHHFDLLPPGGDIIQLELQYNRFDGSCVLKTVELATPEPGKRASIVIVIGLRGKLAQDGKRIVGFLRDGVIAPGFRLIEFGLG